MKEYLLCADVSDVRLSAILFDEALHIKNTNEHSASPVNLRSIHEHASYEIFFVLDGLLRVVNEEKTAEHRDDIVIIPPRFPHYTAADGVNGYCMYFTLSRNQRRLPPAQRLYDRVCLALNSGILSLPLDRDSRFFAERLGECTEDSRLWENAEALVKLLFSSLLRRIAPQRETGAPIPEKQTKYSNIIETYLAQHYTEPIRLEQLAAELFLCRKQVARIIRREYGCSLSDLLNRQRLSVACMLLKHTSLDVGEVAVSVGYEHENYFYTLFRKHYGMTPTQYREANREKTPCQALGETKGEPQGCETQHT